MNGTFTTTRGKQVAIHTYTAPESGWMTTSHIVELPNQLLLVDTPLLADSAREVLAYAKSLGKSIAAVYISHGHPDHFATAGMFEAPVYALPSVAAGINAGGAEMLGGTYMLTGHQGIEAPALPTIEDLADTGEQTIDSVRISFESIANAETGEQLTIGFPGEGILIAQDIIYNHVHAFVAERRFDGWLAAIDALEARPYTVILPGHGLPGDRRLYADARAYVAGARRALAKAEGADDLGERLEAAFPGYGGASMRPVQNYYLFPAAADT